jgi:glutaconate CoA-transferase subunit A
MKINKLIELSAAAHQIESGSSISIGGFTSQRHPMALLRELIRIRRKDFVVYAHSSGSDLDLLIGAGSVRRVEAAYLADGVLAPIAPSWRRFVQAGRLEFEDYSNAAMMARFTAGAMGLPFLPTLSMLGTDMLEKNGISPSKRNLDPVVSNLKAFQMECPFSQRKVVLVPAVNTDFCLLHVQKASVEGLVRIEGQEFLDVQMALAAKKVIVTCEEIADDEELRREPERNRIPPFAIHAVVHVPFGAHPHSVHDWYDYDPAHLTLYNNAAQTDEGLDKYLETFVHGLKDHEQYLDAIGGATLLLSLKAKSGLGYNPELKRTSL